MPIEPFGLLLPDLPALGNPGVLAARNVFRNKTGFEPVPAPRVATAALDDRPRGAVRVRDNSGAARSFVGTEENLFELLGNTWTDRSKSGGYSTDLEERWEFVRWNETLIATNFSDALQVIAMGATEFEDLTTDFRCRHIAGMRNFVLAGNTADSTDGEVRNRLRWCAFNDPGDWTPDPSTLADFEDLTTGGAIVGIRGGEYSCVFQEAAIRRVTFVGSPTVMQIDEVLPGEGFGALARGSIVQDGRVIYLLSERGFLALRDGVSIERIGEDQIDETVLKDIDRDYLSRVSAAFDPVSGRVFFAYPGSGNQEGRPNRVAVLHPRHGWSQLEINLELMWSTGGNSISIDTDDPATPNDSNLDAVDISLDSSRYKGSALAFGFFGEDYASYHFDSAEPLAGAMIETGDQDLGDGRRTHLNAFRVLIEGGDATAQLGLRNLLKDPVVFSDVFGPRPSGRFTRRSNARYRRFRVFPNGNWKKALGIQIQRGNLKLREGR